MLWCVWKVQPQQLSVWRASQVMRKKQKKKYLHNMETRWFDLKLMKDFWGKKDYFLKTILNCRLKKMKRNINDFFFKWNADIFFCIKIKTHRYIFTVRSNTDVHIIYNLHELYNDWVSDLGCSFTAVQQKCFCHKYSPEPIRQQH